MADTPSAPDIPEGSGGHIKVFSPVLAGMMGGTICNKETDREKAARFIADELGETERFTIDQVVFLTWMAYAQQAMQTELNGGQIRPTQQYCAKIIQAFGRNGTQIKGLLRD